METENGKAFERIRGETRENSVTEKSDKNSSSKTEARKGRFFGGSGRTSGGRTPEKQEEKERPGVVSLDKKQNSVDVMANSDKVDIKSTINKNNIPPVRQPKNVDIDVPKKAEDKKSSALEHPEKNEKPKTRTYKKRAKKTSNGSEEMGAILQAVSLMVASRENMAHWAITDKEAIAITEPLAKLIEDSNSKIDLGKYANHIALAGAVGMVMAPKIITQLQLNNLKAKERKENGRKNTGAIEKKGKVFSGDGKIDGKSDGKNAPDGVGNDAFSIPPISGF